MNQTGRCSIQGVSLMLFNEVSLGPQETDLRFRLIHFWEARNPLKKTLIGLEMLLIDEHGTVIQGFVPSGRIKKFMPHMRQGGLYTLTNFYGSRNKEVFRVAAHSVTISFSHNSELAPLENSPVDFEEDRFWFHSYEDFEAGCDMKGDIFELINYKISQQHPASQPVPDVIGHLKLVNGQSLNMRPFIDDAELATTRSILVHDQAAVDFCKKFKSSDNTPSVILVTTVYPKRLGGTLALTSMTSSRVFLDYDVQPTKEYIGWLGRNPDIAKQVNADVVTKTETLTIGEIFSYMKQEAVKDAFFVCTATIDDVVHDSPWYYIACGGCKTKATKGPTSLMCAKCGKNDVAAKISVYYKSDEAIFVLLGDAGRELTGKHASELVSNYFEANGNKENGFEVPVPQALLNTIGQTYKFNVKVTEHNLSGRTRVITVTKVMSPSAPPSTQDPVADQFSGSRNGTLATGDDIIEPSKSPQDSAEVGRKRMGDGVEIGNAKRSKDGN
ncbi:hypothetical protein HID58_086884 [Brassica napus]|uniref:Replication protein A 70 kDa DNA-binding subunit B/D first OB fold domain-containing protein n=1 Tax=Brassica napus TaxID=3708 RepID=A0ABQ7XRQ9_BRANA|nr:hypothetical protein HID58_086884 [Brassica napus]